MEQLLLIQRLLAILQTTSSKEEAVDQMNTLFERDDPFAHTLTSATSRK